MQSGRSHRIKEDWKFIVDWKWKLKTIFSTFCHPLTYKKFFGDSLRNYSINRIKRKKALIPMKPLGQIFDLSKNVNLTNFIRKSSYPTYHELMCIAGIIANRSPRHLLEIGTYEGNTTLQMALNAPNEAMIHTIDLSEEQLGLIPAKRRYEGTQLHQKIRQHYGDSVTYDFSHFTQEGKLDFIFIDADHTYPYVQSDTKKALQILAPGGCIVWHDYTPFIPGVFKHLNELSKEYPLKHIEETSLVLYESP